MSTRRSFIASALAVLASPIGGALAQSWPSLAKDANVKPE